MPKRHMLSRKIKSRKNDTVTKAEILAAIHGYAQQNEERFQKVEYRLDKVEQRLDNVENRLDKIDYRLDQLEDRLIDVSNTLDYIVKGIADLKQDHTTVFGLYKQHDDRLNRHDQQILVLQSQAGLT